VGSAAVASGGLELRRLGQATVSFRRAALRDAAPTGGGAAPLAELVARLHDQAYDVRAIDDGAGRSIDCSRAALEQLLAEGDAHATLAGTSSFALRSLLGWFPDTAPRALVLRRLLLSASAPPRLLARVLKQRDAGRMRFVLDYAYWYAVRRRLPAERWKAIARGTPVLLYHAIGETRSRFVVPPRTLSRQLRLLARLGYRTVDFGELTTALRAGMPVPPRTVVVTADDGYADNDRLAEALARHGFRGTIFLVSDRLGGRVDWTDDAVLRALPLLERPGLEALQRAGIELGAHTRTHASLPELPDDALDDEVAGARAELERTLGRPVASFAYPYGRHDERAVAAVERAGFTGACTVAGRLARLSDDPLQVPRIEIKGSDSLLGFLLKVWFGGG
jgi:peptidoglycan/xylan/chitin deacetylase (PgdA/CDA1 family)